LLDRDYLAGRARLVDLRRALEKIDAGTPPENKGEYAPSDGQESPGTSHLSIVDGEGNAVSFTTTIENGFGAQMMAGGFLLNNQLTDFSFVADENGRPLANRVEAGKRPRSSMAPSFVFTPGGALWMSLGSPGGSAIINYVAKTLVGVIDWKLPLQAAIDAPNMGSRNRETEIERGSVLENLAAALRAMGHPVAAVDLVSGVHGIARTPRGLEGGADPRREGIALGNPRPVH